MAAPTLKTGEKKTRPVPEVVVFDDPEKAFKRRVKQKAVPVDVVDDPGDESPGATTWRTPKFNLRQARYEVLNYGITGFDKSKREEEKMKIAIRLGAKPPKRTYKNYKVLKEEIKAEKDVVKKNRQIDKMYGIKLKPLDKKMKRRPFAVSKMKFHTGKYKDGVVKLTKKEIKKTKTARH